MDGRLAQSRLSHFSAYRRSRWMERPFYCQDFGFFVFKMVPSKTKTGSKIVPQRATRSGVAAAAAAKLKERPLLDLGKVGDGIKEIETGVSQKSCSNAFFHCCPQPIIHKH
jgi:hypothetical protein